MEEAAFVEGIRIVEDIDHIVHIEGSLVGIVDRSQVELIEGVVVAVDAVEG